jgi:hypothetical protein
MLKRWVAMLALALALVATVPAPVGVAEEQSIWTRRPFPGFGVILPSMRRHYLLQRTIPRMPRYYYDNRGTLFGPRRPSGRSDIATSLRARGFRDIGTIQHRGTTYVTEATGPEGERVRLVINGLTGGIDGVRVIGVGKKPK